MEAFYIATPTREMYNHIIELSLKTGISNPITWSNWKLSGFTNWYGNNVGIRNNCLRHSFDPNTAREVTYTEYVKLIGEMKHASLKLNDEYTATINRISNIVQVGCQEFSFSVIKELANMLD